MKLSWSEFARPNTAAYWGTQRLQHRYRIERLAGRWYVSILGRKFAEGFASDGYRTKEGGRRGGHPPRQGRAVEATPRLNLNRAD